MVVAPLMLIQGPPVIDDALLEGAASAWAVLTFASELPTTPEQQDSLGHARLRLLAQIEAVGLSQREIESHLRTRLSKRSSLPLPQQLLPD